MPKVIKQGQLPGDRHYRMTCMNCGTVFEFAHKETKAYESRDQRDSHLRTIACPLPGCAKECLVGPAHEVKTEAPASLLQFPPGARGVAPMEANYYRDH
jgi:hypothetical protein